MDFKIEANGVTPIPAANKITVSKLNTSSDAAPKGPSTSRIGVPLRAVTKSS